MNRSNYTFINEYNSDYFLFNIAFLFFMLLMALILIICVSRKHKDSWGGVLLTAVFLYHTAFSFFYYFSSKYSLTSDTKFYYLSAIRADNLMELYGHGIHFVIFTLYPFVKYFKLTLFSCFMLHNLVGFIGMVFLFLNIKEICKGRYQKWYIWLVLFLPGLNFWTAMIGKDSLIFLGISTLFYGLQNLKHRKVVTFIGLFLIMSVRVYIAIIAIPCLLVSILISTQNIKSVQKYFLIGFLCICMVPAYNSFLNFTKLENLDLEVATKVIAHHQENWGGGKLGHGGSYVDLTNATIFQTVFTYLFRPLFFDAHTMPMMVSSFENLFLILITLSLLNPMNIVFLMKQKSLYLRFNIFYFVVATIILASATPNLGTAVRQKNMIIIALILIYVSCLSYQLNLKSQNQPTNIATN